MRKLRKLLIETLAVVCALLVAAVLIFFFTLNIGQNDYDTFTGYVSKIPLTITSPVYGQIRTLLVKEGSTVSKGQTLATIEIINAGSIPTSNSLYYVQGKILSIRSPSNGVVGQIVQAPLSTVDGAGTLMQLYTPSSTDIQILIPQGYDIHNYIRFFGSNTPNGQQYPLHVIRQIPPNVVSNIPVTTTVYQAACQQISDCQMAINYNVIVIHAQKPQVQSPLRNMLRSWWNKLRQSL